ncbi:MAG TPA: cation diffusion facilitator family transporter [Pseudonocardiaceae bacterium]
MGHGHGHGHGSAAVRAGSASGRYLGRLLVAATLTAGTFVVQLVVGLATSSLAVLSDAAHVFTDLLGLLVAVVAVLVARRNARHPSRTFGMYRAEVVAALVNAALLFVVAGWVLYEAVHRLSAPPEVPGLPVIVVAVVGLLANAVALFLLRDGAEHSLNVRGAYLEVLADLVGSVGVLVSGLLTAVLGWRYADPVVGAAIGLFVLPRAWVLGRRAMRILCQHAPEGVDVERLRGDLAAVPGVAEVHDLHVWTLTSGMEVASAHLAVRSSDDHPGVLAAAQRLLAERYHIEHATLQVELDEQATRCRELSW